MSQPGTHKNPIRVVKVGGSLFDWDGLPEAVTQWLASRPPAQNILIAGGGELADAIRHVASRYKTPEVAAHWLCVDAMSVSAQLLGAILRDRLRVITSWNIFRSLVASGGEDCVFDPREYLRAFEPQTKGTPLPRDWNVTSDSIAARVAIAIEARELMLLKSQDPPAGASPEELAQTGYVDQFFPTIAKDLSASVHYFNLRD